LLVSETYEGLDQPGKSGPVDATGEYESSWGNSLSGLAGREINELMYKTLGKIAKPFPQG
jgi:hypothetical protein